MPGAILKMTIWKTWYREHRFAVLSNGNILPLESKQKTEKGKRRLAHEMRRGGLQVAQSKTGAGMRRSTARRPWRILD